MKKNPYVPYVCQPLRDNSIHEMLLGVWPCDVTKPVLIIIVCIFTLRNLNVVSNANVMQFISLSFIPFQLYEKFHLRK